MNQFLAVGSLLLSCGVASAGLVTVESSLCARAASAFDAGRMQTILDSGAATGTTVSVDLDGDGKEEVLSVRDGMIVSSADKEIDVGGFDGDGVDYLRIVRLGKGVYVLGHEEARLAWMARVNGSFKAELLCEFGRDPRKGRNFALSPYARLEKAAAREYMGDPLIYAVFKRDEAALRLVSQRRGSINIAMKGGETALRWAVRQFDDNSEADLAFLKVMLLLGAEPDAGRNKWDTALHTAITSKKARITNLLFEFAKTVRSVPLDMMLMDKDDPEWTVHVILAQLRAAEHISPMVLGFVLDRRDDEVLRTLAASGLPLAAYYRHWLNGRPSMEAWLLRKIQAVPDPGLRQALLSLRVRITRPKGEEEIPDWMDFERPGQVLLVKHSIMAKVPKPSASTVVEFGTSVCVHLLGGDCGPPKTLERAARWLRSLPWDCPETLARIYDPTICVLAQEYAKSPHQYEMFVGPNWDEEVPFVPAVQALGVRSIAPAWNSTGIVSPR